jgi:hypothetical protein
MYNSMRDDRQPTGFGMRSIGSKWLYAGRLTTIVGCVPLLSACATGILEPQGPIGAAEKSILIDSVAIMLARLQRQGPPSSGLGLLGPYRTCCLGDSGTRRYVVGWRGMDRIT